MSDTRLWTSCAQPEALVLIKVLPLCQIDADDLVAFGLLAAELCVLMDDGAPALAGLPASCATVMSCAEALAFVEEVDHVGC